MSTRLDEERGHAAPGSMGTSVLRGGAWQSTSRVVGQASTLVVSIVAARQLGASGMGRLVFITYIHTTLAALLSAGLPIAVNRFTAELIGAGRREAVRFLYHWARRVELVAASVGSGVLVSVYLAGGEPPAAWLAAAAACPAAALQSIPYAVLLGARRWRHASLIGLATGLAGAAAKLALLAGGQGIAALVTVDAAVAAVNLAAASVLARRAMGPAVHAAPPDDLLPRAGRYAMASTAAVVLGLVVLQRSEILFLQRFSDDAEIALYSIPFSAVQLLNLVPATLAVAAASVFATLFGAGAYDRIRNGFGRATRLTLATTIPLTVASIVLGPDALRLAYGDDYADTGPVLVILLLAFPLFSLMSMSTSVVQGFGKQRAPLVILGVATVVALALDLSLIPAFDALGAAVANATSQAVAAALYLVYAVRLVGGIEWELAVLTRLVLAALVSGGVALVPILALPALAGLLVGSVAFVVALAVIARIIGVVSSRDTTWLAEAMGTRFGENARRVVLALSPRVDRAVVR